MPKPSLKKAELLEGLDGLQPSLSDSPSEVLYKAMQYRVQRILSDTPPGTTPSTYPFIQSDGGKVLLHDIFKPLFPKGKIPMMSKDHADRLFSTILGYHSKNGLPARIYKEPNDTITIKVFEPSGESYKIDCFTGLKVEE